jgi:transcription elongation factor GreA
MMDLATIESRMREMEELIANGQLQELERAWQEAAEEGPSDLAPFFELAQRLAKSQQQAKASVLLEKLVDPLLERGASDLACEAVNMAAEIDGNNASLKDAARKAYSKRFDGVPGFEEVLAETDRDHAYSAGAFVGALKELCSFRVGDYLFHGKGWGLGRVTGLDLLNRQLIVDFDDEKGHPVKLESATEYFQRLPSDHLLVRLSDDIGGLRTEAETDPSAVIRCTLRSLEGRITLKRLKEALVPEVIARTQWSKWWNSVRRQMVERGQLRVGGTGPTSEVELLMIPTTLEDEYGIKLAACHSGVEFVTVLRKYLEVSREGIHRVEFLESKLRDLARVISHDDARTATDGQKTLVRFAYDLALAVEPDMEQTYQFDVAAVAADSSKFLAAIEEMGLPEFERKLLGICEEANPKWKQAYADALLRSVPNSWDFIADTLREAGEEKLLHARGQTIWAHAYKPLETEETIEEEKLDGTKTPVTVKSRRVFPRQFLWLATRVITTDSPADWGLNQSKLQVLTEVLRLGTDLYHRVERGERLAKALVLNFRDTLAAGNVKLLRTVVAEELDLDRARALRQQIQVNRSLSEARVEAMLAILDAEYPELAVSAAAADAKQVGDEEVLTTALGLRRKRDEQRRILNEELPSVERAIVEAIGYGDVSENAELDAARERKDVINATLAEINRDLARARVVTADEIDDSRVGFGTVVALRNSESKETVTYTILGRWDVDIPRGIISYNSAIAKGLEGLRTGQSRRIKTPDGKEVEYEVLSISQAPYDETN